MPHCVFGKGQTHATQDHFLAFLWHYIIQQTYKWNVKIMLNDEEARNWVYMKWNVHEKQ